MADISMCANHNCPARVNCYRFRAFPSEYQTYSTFTPTGPGGCKEIIPIISTDNLRPFAEIMPMKEKANGN